MHLNSITKINIQRNNRSTKWSYFIGRQQLKALWTVEHIYTAL